MDLIFYNEIYIVRGNRDNTDNDSIYLFKKPKPISHTLSKYDSLIHKKHSVPKLEGILTFSYHLYQDFDRRHLFYGKIGTHVDEKSVDKVLNLMFGHVTDNNHDEKEGYNYQIFTEKICDKIIYIQKEHTQRAIADDYFSERFDSVQQLFYLLRYEYI